MARSIASAEYPYHGRCERCECGPLPLAAVLLPRDPGLAALASDELLARLWCPDCVREAKETSPSPSRGSRIFQG